MPRRRVLSVQPVAERGGSDQALLGLVTQLSNAGWECHVALPGSSPLESELVAAGATLHVVPMRRISGSHSITNWFGYALAWPFTVLRLSILAKRCHAEVVHSNSLHSWYGWATALICRVPHVWHAREIVTQSPVALKVERFLAKHFATRVIAISQAVASQLDQANVSVVYDEANPEIFEPSRAGSFRKKSDIRDEVPLVGFVGRLDTWKGTDVLLDAYELLRKLNPQAEMVIVGVPVSGKELYARKLEERSKQIGVHWAGPSEEVGEVMADLDCLALPSTEPEPFGLVMVEALASGTPVVATSAGGPSEILPKCPPEAGNLVQAGDPAALAEAVAQVLPERTSTEARRSRKPIRPRSAMTLRDVFNSLG